MQRADSQLRGAAEVLSDRALPAGYPVQRAGAALRVNVAPSRRCEVASSWTPLPPLVPSAVAEAARAADRPAGIGGAGRHAGAVSPGQ